MGAQGKREQRARIMVTLHLVVNCTMCSYFDAWLLLDVGLHVEVVQAELAADATSFFVAVWDTDQATLSVFQAG